MSEPFLPTLHDLSPSLARAVESARGRFEADWQTWRAGPPRAEAYLGDAQEPARSVLLTELLRVEMACRRTLGESPSREEYRRRFPREPWLDALLDAAELSLRDAGPQNTTSLAGRQVCPVKETMLLPGQDAGSAEPALPASGRPLGGVGALPGYEILRVLGRGGMGIVYEARQIRLDRTVAVKMVLAGGHADEVELARFRTEAEAIARLQHPHIVLIHEVGEHEGRPFFSLEYCAGGSLAHRLREEVLPPAEAAALLEKLARGIQAAHEARVLHRDLKPANVLLARDGTPKITDFGLARKLDDVGHTQTGAVMGTPSYMAPEQAEGRKDLGPAVDVYALGAILYECLTGRPPFRAAAMMDTLMQVIHEEPAPPRQLNALVPRDLETICLKCLQKDPARRYSSALELAEDLRRFQANEPILARPVRRWERAVKWVRRNPVVAALAAAVVLALLGGATVSSVLAVKATSEAENARRSEGRARLREEQATRARQDLEAKNDELLLVSAQALGRPLVLEDRLAAAPPLNDAEIQALQDLAATPQEKLRILFVQEALRSPETAAQLRTRAEPALHAAVGLDADLRDRIEKLLLERLQNVAGEEERLDVAGTLASLGSLSPPAAGTAGRVLARAMSRTSTPAALQHLAERLAALAPAMEAGEAADACSRAAALLTQAMTKTTEPTALQHLLDGLWAVTSRMGPADTRGAAGLLVQALSRTTDPDARQSLSVYLTEVASRMEPGEAADLLIRAAREVKDTEVLTPLARGLADLAPRLGAKEAGEAAAIFLPPALAPVGDRGSPYPVQCFCETLSALAPRLAPADAAGAAAPLADALVQTPRPDPQRHRAGALAALAPAMKPGEGAALLARVMGTGTQLQPPALASLSVSLESVLARMKPKEAAAFLARAASRTLAPDALPHVFSSLEALTPSMDPGDAAELAPRLIQVMNRTIPPVALARLSVALAAAASRMKAGEAAALLAQAVIRTGDPAAARSLAAALTLVATRMDARAAAEAAAVLGQVMTGLPPTGNFPALQHLSVALAAAASRMEAGEAARTCSRAATLLIPAMSRISGSVELRDRSEALWALLPRMEAGEAAPLLIKAMGTAPPPFVLEVLSGQLRAVASRMEAREAAVACGQAASLLAQAMTRTTDPTTLVSLALELAELAAGMEAREAARVCTQAAALLAQATARTTDPEALHHLSEGLGALSSRMEVREAANVCSPSAALLVQVMTRTTEPAALRRLSEGLADLSPWVGAGELADLLTRAMPATAYPTAQRQLSESLAGVAARMEPGKAAGVCSRAATLLAQEICKTTDPSALRHLSRGLAAVAPRMGPGEAGEAAALLTRAMTGTTHLLVQLHLLEGLSVVAPRMEPGAAAGVCSRAAPLLVQAMIRARDLIQREQPLSRDQSKVLAALAARMEAEEAVAVCDEAGKLLAQAMGRTAEPANLRSLSAGLRELSSRMKPGVAAPLLTQAMTRTTDEEALRSLTGGLSAVAPRLDPAAAAALVAQAMTRTTSIVAVELLSGQLAALTARMEPEEAALLIIQALTRTSDLWPRHRLSEVLTLVLLGAAEPAEPTRRAALLARGVAHLAGTASPVAALSLLGPALRLTPCRLNTQQLVELLQRAACVGESRRIVLDQLEKLHGQPFADHWAFVRFAKSQQLPLDLNRPLRRVAR